MKFIGENLFPGQIGHFFVILSFVASLVALIAYIRGTKDASWVKLGRISYYVQAIAAFSVFAAIFYICYNHLYEYMYAYKHASKELEMKYLLACIWEGQEGSFLLWALWQALLGIALIAYLRKKKMAEWEAPAMTMFSLSQTILYIMILGIYFFGVKIGNSPFTLTRNEISAPIFSRPDYLSFIKDGMGLNVLLRNYWMVIHPPVLFLGFGALLVPFSLAFAGLRLQKFGEWIKPAIPWSLFGAAVLGIGIMMGGRWAYESLSFGGYWAWDPVENASLVPWMTLVAGLHTMVIYQSTKQSLKMSFWLVFVSYGLVLYSTFLTRTGILGETSVHSFTEAGTAINYLLIGFVSSFFIIPTWLMISRNKQIPVLQAEETVSSREFWMYVGSLVLFLSALFIIIKTSAPVYNKITGSNIAPPEDIEFSYNKVVIMAVVVILILTAITQFFKYKKTEKGFVIKGILIPSILAAGITAILAFVYPYVYYKHGAGFLGAIYLASFAAIYTFIANGYYLFKYLKGSVLKGGGSIAHLGFGLMVLGILISSSNKQVISDSKVNGINVPGSIDPMTKKADDPAENLTLLRDIPTRMADYLVTYTGDSAGHEKGRRFFSMEFKHRMKENNSFTLQPDVYVMKDNNMSSNPDIKSWPHKDIYTFISWAMNNSAASADTLAFTVKELAKGDTLIYSNGYMILKDIVNKPERKNISLPAGTMGLMANLEVHSRDSNIYKVSPIITVDDIGLSPIDDTLYAQNLFVRFAGVNDDMQKIKVGFKESNKFIDFITIKAIQFPYISLVWIGLVIMSIGFLISMVHREKLSRGAALAILIPSLIVLTWLFLFAN